MYRTKFRSLLLTTFCLLSLVAPVAARPAPVDPLAGNWVWKSPVDKRGHRTEFTIRIERKGDAVTGTFSVDDYVRGKWQGEDGNQTPFRGEVRDGALVIEFDAAGAVPGYEENVVYTPPTDGRTPSTAKIVRVDETLEWTHVTGDAVEGVPNELKLVRPKSK